MNNRCIHIKKRTKGVYCANKGAYIDFKTCNGCLNKEYKKVSKNSLKPLKRTPINKVSKTNKVTKATSIPTKVKKIVWERDYGRCIFCQKPVSWNYANSHFIKRSHLGKGIEQNIMTNCDRCHKLFEESIFREKMLAFAKSYLMSKYEDWNEEMLVYKKGSN